MIKLAKTISSQGEAMKLSKVFKLSAFALLVWAAISSSATTAQAALVKYYTTGAFGNAPVPPGSASSSISSGGITITFTGVGTSGSPYDVIANPTTHDSLGTFTIAGTSGSLASFANTVFTLYITQMVPTPSSGYATFTSAISGTIQYQSSDAYVTFADPRSQVIHSLGSPSAVTYTVEQKRKLTPPNDGNHGLATVSLEGDITAAPEPSTVALAVAGLPFFGFVAWRRKRRNPA